MGDETSLWRAVIGELRRNPIATLCGIMSVILSGVGLLISADISENRISHIASATSIHPAAHYIIFSATLLATGTFAATLSRIVNGISALSAYFTSILSAAFGMLICTIVAQNLGFELRPMGDAHRAVSQINYWGHVLIFATINARPVRLNFVGFFKDKDEIHNPKDKLEELQAMVGVCGIVAIVIVCWFGALNRAQVEIIRFLTSG